MPKFFSKYKKIIFSLVLIFVITSLGIFVFGAENTQAGHFYYLGYDSIFDMIVGIIAIIGVFFKSIAFLFFWVASMVLEMAFGLEKFTDAGVVQIGWKITRDVANMLFVVGLLIIAGATALNIETYGIKKLLPKLIIAALLINFSLVIAGVIIDFTQVVTHFFYDEMNQGNGIVAQFAQMMHISALPELNADAEFGKKLAEGVSGSIMMIFSIFLEIIFILAASLAIAIGAFFLIVRLITLWILLILAPMAWAMWVLPATDHLFKKWWSDFFKWAFFAPIYAFFIYLAVVAYSSGAFSAIINSEMENIVNASGWGGTLGSAFLAVPSSFMQFLVIIGLLFGGLIVAQKLGVYGAAGMVDIAKKAQKGAGNWTKRKAQRATARPSGWVGRKLDDASKRMGWKGRLIGAKVLTRQAGRGFRSLEERERAAVKKEEEKYKGYSGGNLKRLFKSVDARGQMAILNVLAKQKDLKADEKLGFTGADIEKTIKTAKRYSIEKDIIGARPDLAAPEKPAKGYGAKKGLFGTKPESEVSEKQSEKKIKETIKQSFSFKSEDLTKIQPEAYKIDKKNPEKTPRQEVFRKILLESATAEDGKMSVSVLHKLAETNPTLFFHIKEEITQHIASKENEAKTRKDRPDIMDYIESGADKAFSSVNYRRPKESTEEQQAKQKLEGMFGTVKAWKK